MVRSQLRGLSLLEEVIEEVLEFGSFFALPVPKERTMSGVLR